MLDPVAFAGSMEGLAPMTEQVALKHYFQSARWIPLVPGHLLGHTPSLLYYYSILFWPAKEQLIELLGDFLTQRSST